MGPKSRTLDLLLFFHLVVGLPDLPPINLAVALKDEGKTVRSFIRGILIRLSDQEPSHTTKGRETPRFLLCINPTRSIMGPIFPTPGPKESGVSGVLLGRGRRWFGPLAGRPLSWTRLSRRVCADTKLFLSPPPSVPPPPSLRHHPPADPDPTLYPPYHSFCLFRRSVKSPRRYDAGDLGEKEYTRLYATEECGTRVSAGLSAVGPPSTRNTSALRTSPSTSVAQASTLSGASRTRPRGLRVGPHSRRRVRPLSRPPSPS